ncbi:MAG: hypothetical protein WCA27_30110 [Candidatus Sulfotelmatobacter sp.]
MTKQTNRDEKLFSMKTVPEAKEVEALTEDEKTQLLAYYIAEADAGRIAFRRPGRPRQGSTAVSLHDLVGITRQDACQWRKLASASKGVEIELGPRNGTYTMLVKGGQRRAVDDMDTFEGTALGQLAENLLAPAERLLRHRSLTKAEQKQLVRALRCRLQRLALIWRGAED